ncbi:MAG: HAD family hydrolase, partial [cyanobacterium endosymbiont of Rhopalodia fuxianensis]
MVISTEPQILALDFDGVICNGLLEYFQTTKSTYTQIWTEHPSDFLNN